MSIGQAADESREIDAIGAQKLKQKCREQGDAGYRSGDRQCCPETERAITRMCGGSSMSSTPRG